ncbi:hypothetical protein ERO13_A06G162350v2 [Gossypium hirsutum]|nr:hypothetical protein ERO13_A06G162350v2 [Gossypium hirsutum]
MSGHLQPFYLLFIVRTSKEKEKPLFSFLEVRLLHMDS